MDNLTMPIIMSPYDTRFVTLIGVAIDLAEELALAKGGEPTEHLATALYVANKSTHECGEQRYLDKLARHYPLLKEAIT